MNLEELAAFREPDWDEVARHKARMMAEQLDVSQNRVSTIERGDIDRTQVATLCRHEKGARSAS